MAQWFYVSGGQQTGPFDEPQLRAMIAGGQVGADDLVWREGMAQWISARDSGLMAAAQAVGGQPMPLAYASPVTAEAPAVPHDEGPFLKLGRQFNISSGGRWSGMAVASPRAIYLLKLSRQASGTAYGLGGVAGILIHKAFSQPDDIRTCSVGDLPPAVRQMIDPKSKKLRKDVVVLPREATRLVKAGSVNNVINVHVGPEKFTMHRGLFSGGKVRRFMTDNGWTLNQEVLPTMSPIHGQGLGRTFEEMEKKKPSTSSRVILAVLGVLLIVAIIVAQILRNM